MGQKTHPLGFRLGITQQHRAAWYSNFSQYASLLEEDDQIRTYLNKLAKTASISNITINRKCLVGMRGWFDCRFWYDGRFFRDS